jgi:hypothetical protein
MTKPTAKQAKPQQGSWTRKTGESMNRIRFVTLFVFASLMSACTTTEHMKWVGVGGSKADGIVILGFDVPPKMGISETLVHYDKEQASTEADKRCRNWGYSGAEIFHNDFPVLVVCHPQGLSPCWSKTYRISYQCLDKPR